MNTDTILLLNLSDRLNYALSVTGIKKAELARLISVKPQIIQFLCNSKTRASRFTFEIATVLGLNTKWLATGEGTMFLADDPKNQFLKKYDSIPLLQGDNLKDVFLYNKPANYSSVCEWLPLRNFDSNIYSIEMNDSSMEPYFPLGSFVFIKKCLPEETFKSKYVFSYLTKFDTFVVRRLVEYPNGKFLEPSNKELFNSIKITNDINLLGIITDCFWHIRN
ncbi:MAG: hypothetical protein H0U75_11130 [Legionella sp.]|nr:hypothetical protein [Legionella sp.]